jgi:hypothetical protein
MEELTMTDLFEFTLHPSGVAEGVNDTYVLGQGTLSSGVELIKRRKHGLRAMVQNIWTKDTGPDTMEDRTRIMIQDTKNRAITIVVNS